MKARNPFAYDRSGSVIVTVDGTEVLVASASDGAPLWHLRCSDEIVGVGSTEEEVVVLDATGNLIWSNAETGAENDRVKLDGKPLSLAVDGDGVAAVVLSGTVSLIDPGDRPRKLKVAHARRVAWSVDGTRFAVGTRDGRVAVFEEETLAELGSVELESGVLDLCFVAPDSWLAATTEGLFLLDDEANDSQRFAEKLLRGEGNEPVDAVASSEDGLLVALRQGQHRLSIVSQDGTLAATVKVPDRELHGVAFGPHPWLGIGLDGGDVNRVNLRAGTVKQVEPHPHRSNAMEPWVVEFTAVEEGALKKKKKGKPAASALPRTEAEINSPDTKTLGYLGAIALTSVILWSSARFACNAHPPESRKAREVGTVELSHLPKGAAVEMFQRLATRDYDGALELTDGPPHKEVERLKKDCDAAKAACDADQERLKTVVLTTAELLSADTTKAKAKVTSIVPGEPNKVYDVDLAFSEPIWKVTRYSPVK